MQKRFTRLPITRNCEIFKEYCQFIEIVEHTYNKHFPKSSFKKAIEEAISRCVALPVEEVQKLAEELK